VRYELGLYITEDSILHSHHLGNIKSYSVLEVDIFPSSCEGMVTPTLLGPSEIANLNQCLGIFKLFTIPDDEQMP
jgi:hypothetical protein